MKEMSPLEELRHSCSHVLATAILRLFPETKLDIGPPTESGFYYDIDLDKKLKIGKTGRFQKLYFQIEIKNDNPKNGTLPKVVFPKINTKPEKR